jgi:tRNA(fMet)-specific endonuclease VapC
VRRKDLAYLIDSDWTIDYLKGRPAASSLLTGLLSDGIAISIVTYAEVYEGIYSGGNRRAHEAALRGFLRVADLVSITMPIARRYARISGDLRAQGLLIPAPDLFIAATALHHNLTLVTRNRRHFARIPNLKLYP